MIKLSEYVDYEGEIKLYKYRITNLANGYLKFHLKANDLIILDYESTVTGYIPQSTISIVEKPEDDKAFYNFIDSFQFITNDIVYEPIVSSRNDFFLFSLKDKENIDFEKDELYFIDSSSSVDYDFSPESNNEHYLYQIQFANIKQLKNYDIRKIEYKFKDEINLKPTKQIYLKVEPTILISDLVFKGRKVINNSNILHNYVPNYKIKADITPVKFYPHLVHPINVQKEYDCWLDQTNIFFDLFNTHFYNKDRIEWNTIYKNLILRYLQNIESKELKEFLNLINDCIGVTETIASGYKKIYDGGEDIKDKDAFQNRIYSGNDPKQFCDFKIFNFLKFFSYDNPAITKTLETILLMFSEYIPSNWTFKGGLTQEHELYLPFYLETSQTSGVWNIKSNFYIFNSQKNIWEPKDNLLSNHNIFSFHTKLIALPILPEKISEINISNTPLDFNTSNSHNFNYLMWNPSKSSDIEKYFASLKPEKPNLEYIYKKVSWKLDTKPPHPRSRFDEQPDEEYYPIYPNVPENAENRWKSWDDFWKLNSWRPEIKSILENPEYKDYDKDYLARSIRIWRENFKTSYSPFNSNHGAQKGWSLCFDAEWLVLTFKIKIDLNKYEFPKPDFLYKNERDFLNTLNVDHREKLLICFEIEDDDFILEDITIKSIYANELDVEIKDCMHKVYKLNYNESKTAGETKIII
ncbi:hypothetical protein [Metamycoplasma hyosynoviae]|uniref:hypothetical protein n=1 Tax=Metamycoplasma hyosynoviae TaxID=29559 RepID=UPI0023611DE9|nr:hypothetical protein [Metamycoplasma hyosynoviae]MDD1373916.1 hypothetical protein [Metamycoplasma hyosynoviae]MDD1375396.1 hypothetical protein [Metamycoplasma hyosynoviae]MDD1376385.1 hypothetical protein [Metamycoplasma hyosynoviae]MDD1377008.1 hypothetical protein [Metamycoplasma hyosynoviae]